MDGNVQLTAKGAGTEVCSFGMRQLELDPVQRHLHSRAELQTWLLDALDAAEHPGKAFVKCKGKGKTKCLTEAKMIEWILKR